MKRFLVSVVIGGLVGSICALGFLFIAPRLPYIFAQLLFYPKSETPVTIIQDIQRIFKPDTGQYFIAGADESFGTSTKVLYADLGSMNIALYEGGQKIGEYPIQSIGREGTAWQTPLGTFDMSYKNENHFSSIGHVWMPYSMHFFGNYFIHGWPYYDGGVPVARGYSGGCIRLNTPDAGEVYKFVDKNTRLIVTTNKKPELQKDFQYQIQKEAPDVSSAYLIADIVTGEVVASHDASLQMEAGSFAKLMTGLISLETLNQYQEAVLNQDIVKISDVLYSLLLVDSDEAGTVFSEHKNKSQYIIDMNTRAHSLDMFQTKYTDVNGDNAQTISSLEDTFRLVQYINAYKPFLLKVLSLDSYTLGQTKQESTNPLKGTIGYVAGFSSEGGDESISLVTVDVSNTKLNTIEKKTFAIIAKSTGNASSDVLRLYEWLEQGIEVREY